MNPTYLQTILTVNDATNYIDALAAADLLFHFDDDAADCLRAHQLRHRQIEAIEQNVDQLMRIDWTGTGYEDAFDYVCTKHSQ